MHVFIEAGLKSVEKETLRILEMGFGTGLNCLLTCLNNLNKNIDYVGIEKYPLIQEEFNHLQYCEKVDHPMCSAIFNSIHEAPWNAAFSINNKFTLTKIHAGLNDYNSNHLFDLVYFDAFSPEVQPELWTMDIFKKIYGMLTTGGVLVTYCAKGYVRRNMQQCGFTVQRLPGSPGKREMLRAIKT